MVCEHLRALEEELLKTVIEVIYRGQAWGDNCREWVYFDCFIDRKSVQGRFRFPEFVIYHKHLGTHDGQEAGFRCTRCNDAVMGHHEYYFRNHVPDKPVFK